MSEATQVTVENFARAETDAMFSAYAAQGGFGKFLHLRQPTPLDEQKVIRMNRDTLYSIAVVDLTQPVTVVKPDSSGRFQSLLVISEDHYALPVEHGYGEFTYTRDQVGTRYAAIVVRTFMDADDPADIAKANAAQDALELQQADVGSFEVPSWDQTSRKVVHDALITLANTLHGFDDAFGTKGEVDPVAHLLGTAAGWGGNPRSAAMYLNEFTEHNDGVTPYVLKVGDVPVDGFWSVTVYNKDGFIEPNEYEAYSFNNVTAAHDADGTISIHFGGASTDGNFLPIMPGWNYAVRMYQPRAELLDGTWTFPSAEVAS